LLEDELDVVRGTLARQSAALSHRRAQNSALTQDLQDSKNRLTQLESEYHAVEEQAREAAECENDMEKRMGSVESMLADAEAKLKRMERQLEDAKKEQYKKSTDLHAMRDRETFLHSEIAGIQAQNKNLQSKLQHYDAEAFKQQELLYNIEFQIQQMERKVSRLQGERTEEEKRALKDKIEDLNAELDEKQKALKVVQEQLKRVNDDVRRATRQLADKSQEEESLRSKISELTLENENAQIEIRGAMKDKETLLVQHDLLRLQVKKLRDQLNARRDELLGLQNRKEQLRLSILERVDEVTVFRESLRAELKCASEEKHKLILEMKERQMQVDRMKTKFGMIVERIKAMSRLGDEDSAPTIDEGEEGPTQAQFLIRVAQQREELQRQGDELDGKIAKLEKEERALKKTLNLLQAKNSDFSASIKKADLGGPDAEKKLQLEEKLRAVRSTVQAQRKEVAEIEDDNIRLEQQIGALEGEQQHIAQNIEKLHGDQDVLRREMSEQTEKMQQYEQKLTRLRESIRPSNNASEMIPEEMDIMTLEVRNKNKETVQRVMQLAQANPRVSGVLEQLMAELGISGGATRTSMSRVPVGQSNADRPDSARSHASNASDRSNRSSRSNGSVRATMAPKPVAPVLR
jgi:chromosome segregation ATPase